ncbi:MAG: universal stress protein [Chloroflexi bacterium]|nr:universal stress protein [Chloroflexota bacterium]
MKILVPLANPNTAPDLIRIASGIIYGGTGEAVALGVVEIPEHESMSEGAVLARQQRRLLQRVLDIGQAENVDIRTVVRIARRAWQGIRDEVLEENIDLMLMGWHGEAKQDDRLFGETIEEIVKAPPCDIAVVKQRGIDRVQRILLPARGGRHAELALKLAISISVKFESAVTVLHVHPEDDSPEGTHGEEAFAKFASHCQEVCRARLINLRSDSVAAAIVGEAKKHELVIMGATERPEVDDHYLFGPIAEEVVARAEASVMVVKSRNGQSEARSE